MNLLTIKQNISRYILERSCPRGGFCFYRLDEPNPQDTYHALAALHLLHVPYHNEQTIQYLQSLQHGDGTYESLTQTYFILLSLKFLGSRPLHAPAGGIEVLANRILSFTSTHDDTPRSLFHALYQLVALYEEMKFDWRENQRESITQLLLAHHNRDGGFGIESSNLLSTFPAVAALRLLDHPLASARIEPFLRSCEHPVFGFTGKPETSLYFLEYLHAGLALCDEMSLRPTYGQACASFMYQCQNDSGGFARASLGIATIENTCLAVHGITILEQMGIL